MAQIERRTTKKGVRFSARVFRGRDATGKRLLESRTFHTLASARAWAREAETAIQRGVFAGRSTITLRAYLGEWLDGTAKLAVRPKTLSSYHWLLHHYFIPSLGELRVQDLRTSHLNRLYVDLSEGRAKTSRGKPLAPRSVRLLHAVVHSALTDARKTGLLAANPAADAGLPRQKRREMNAWTPEQARAFLSVARGERLYAFWRVMVTVGTRPSEALALRWDDINGDVLRIVRSLTYENATKWSLEDTKTQGSKRNVVLDEETLAALKTHRAHQAKAKLAAGATYVDFGLIFAGPTGAPLSSATLGRATLARLCRTAAVPKIRLYDLRHTSASCLMALNVHPKVVSERLGHSSTTLTMNVYSHVTPNMQADATDRLARSLAG